MGNVALVGALDTKGVEYAFTRDVLTGAGAGVVVIDVGILGQADFAPDITRHDVAAAAGHSIDELARSADRGAAVTAMAEGLAVVLLALHAEGRIDSVLGMGGTGGTTLVTHGMRSLPIGVPKIMVSTVASGDTAPYVGSSDLTLMHSVVDIAGVNRISRQILTNAALAAAGMAEQPHLPAESDPRPLVAATMFGVTTPAVTRARELLESAGLEVLVFHATGVGGRTMEALVADAYVVGVLDLTTTELADELVGGVFSAGPNRLRAAGARGIPQVVSLGALDMVNFGPRDSVPRKHRDRTLHQHNESVTLMRTTRDECAELGRRIASRLNAAEGPVSLFVPLRGVSLLSVEGQPFCDRSADEQLFASLREHVDPEVVELVEIDTDINDPAFANAMASRLIELLKLADQVVAT